MFSSDRVAEFWDRGYLVERALADRPLVRRINARTTHDLERLVAPYELEADVAYPGAPAGRDEPGGHTVRRLRGAYDRAPELRQWARDTRVTDRVAALLDTRTLWLVRAHHNCVMTKMPRYSSATHWHQDIRYWRFSDARLINVWLALGPETERNGCMRVIPGSHRLQLPGERFDDAKFLRADHPQNDLLIRSAVPITLAAGDALFFHAGTFHAAGRNQTQRRKCALVYTYHGEQTQALAQTQSGHPRAVQVR